MNTNLIKSQDKLKCSLYFNLIVQKHNLFIQLSGIVINCLLEAECDFDD